VAQIIPGTLAITVDFSKARPTANPQTDNCIYHLGSGRPGTNPSTWPYAVTWKAELDVALDPADAIVPVPNGGMQIMGWLAGFRQVQTVDEMSLLYVGRQPRDGDSVMHPHRALPSLSLADTVHTVWPWMTVVPYSVVQYKAPAIVHVVSAGGDQPAGNLNPAVGNIETSRLNYLYHLIDHRSFLTAFCTLDAAAGFAILGHFRWSILYDFYAYWQDGPGEPQPRLHRNASVVTPPSHVDYTSVSDPGGLLEFQPVPFANPEMDKAIKLTYNDVNKRKPRNLRNDSNSRSASVPNDFFS